MKIYLIILICFLLIGCKTKTVYVPIESVKTKYEDRYLRDSIFEKEYINVYQKGDTVFLDKFKYIYKDRFKNDSIYINDTIRLPYPVEKQLSKWEQTKMDIGGWAIGVGSVLLLVVITYVILWLIKKRF